MAIFLGQITLFEVPFCDFIQNVHIHVDKSERMELSQKSLTGIQKFFLFQVPMNILKDWKAKLESAYIFMFKYSKFTVLLYCGL